MITDLATQSASCRNLETDVLIIGAGIAGLVLAARLRGKKARVTILESGGLTQTAESHPLNRVVQLGDAYSGATRGRFRCLGGTSTRWGGALVPFLANDLDERPHIDLPAFPVGMDALVPYLREIEKLFGVDAGSYEEQFVEQIRAAKYIPTGDPDFQARFAKWPSFKNRNVALLLHKMLQHDRDLEVSINSTVTSFDVTDNRRIASVTSRHESGRSVTVTAKKIVICAGAIESTRLLLILDRQYDQRIFKGCDALGRYFYDHISMPVAQIRAKDVIKLNRMAGFRFVGSTMRSLRFELSPFVQQNERVGSAFGHISFKTQRSTGFDLLRELMRSKQRGGHPTPKQVLAVLSDVPYFARLAFWRAVHKQLLWPTPAEYELHVVAEQLPHAANYIALSSEADAFGLPVAAINWRILSQDINTFSVFKRRFDSFWNRRGLYAVGELQWINSTESYSSDRTYQADVYHPGGSTRMGTNGHSAVVDENLKVFGISNLWTASTAVFPSGGGANPTLTLMLFAMRLADQLNSQRKAA